MRLPIAVATALFIGTTASQAAVIGVSGGTSTIGSGGSAVAGAAPAIIAAPADANDDAAFNTGIQAFDEQQGYTLGGALGVDGGTIAGGTTVNSHMIFLNSGPGNSSTLIEHGAGNNQNAVSFTFDGVILGVMSSSNGSLEIASQFLGATGTAYPASTFAARGMENNPLTGGTGDDWYAISGDTISLGMRVTEPGDWIRVVTAVAPVPVPAAMPLLLAGLGGLGFMARRKKRNAA